MTFPIGGLSSAAPYLGVEESTEKADMSPVASAAGAVIAPAPATAVGPGIGEGGTEGFGGSNLPQFGLPGTQVGGVGSNLPQFGLPGTQLGGLGSPIGGTEGEDGNSSSGVGLQGSSGSGPSSGVRLGGWGAAADNPDGGGDGGSDVAFGEDEGSTFTNNGDGTVSGSDGTNSNGTTSDVTFSDEEAGAMVNSGDGYIDQMGNAANGQAGEDSVGQFLVGLGGGISSAFATGEEIGKAILSELGAAAVEKVVSGPEGNSPNYGPGEPVDGGVPGGVPGPGLETPVPDGGGPVGPASTLFMPTPDGTGPAGPASVLVMPTPDGTGPTGPASNVKSLPELGGRLRLS